VEKDASGKNRYVWKDTGLPLEGQELKNARSRYSKIMKSSPDRRAQAREKEAARVAKIEAQREREKEELKELTNANPDAIKMKALQLLGKANDNAKEAGKDATELAKKANDNAKELAKKANDNVNAGVSLVLGSNATPSNAAPVASPSASEELFDEEPDLEEEKSTAEDTIGISKEPEFEDTTTIEDSIGTKEPELKEEKSTLEDTVTTEAPELEEEKSTLEDTTVEDTSKESDDVVILKWAVPKDAIATVAPLDVFDSRMTDHSWYRVERAEFNEVSLNDIVDCFFDGVQSPHPEDNTKFVVEGNGAKLVLSRRDSSIVTILLESEGNWGGDRGVRGDRPPFPLAQPFLEGKISPVEFVHQVRNYIVFSRKLAGQHNERWKKTCLDLDQEEKRHDATKGRLLTEKEYHKDTKDECKRLRKEDSALAEFNLQATENDLAATEEDLVVANFYLRREKEAHARTKSQYEEALQAEKEKVARLESQLAGQGQSKRDRDGGETGDERPKKKSRVGE
ncbi:MAG: hypothetical protein SGILL_007906, partial [Bacillariaceae sp.]